jgi:hypothetical protein
MKLRMMTTSLGLCTLLVLTAGSAAGHHSIAMFDNSKTLTLNGTVNKFEWVNPHVLLWVNVESATGEKQLWVAELGSPGTLIRNGWTKRSFNPGEKISLDVGPLRDGKTGGFFKKATLLESGKVLTYTLEPQAKPDAK